MTRTRCFPIAVAVAVLTGVAAVAGTLFLTVSPTAFGIAYYATAVTVGAVSTALGLLVARRRPTNPVGPLLTLIGLVPAVLTAIDVYNDVSTRRPDVLPNIDTFNALNQGSWMWWYVPVGLLMLVFPDGRLLGRRWRWVVVGLVADPIPFGLLGSATPGTIPPPYQHLPHPLGLLPFPVAWTLVAIALPGLFVLLTLSAASMVIRYRRSDPVRRAQLKWFALSAVYLPGTLLLCWIGLLFFGTVDLALIGLVLLYLAMPAATTIAMLRYDLYDVDRALSAAVTYGAVTAALLAVFTAVSFAGGLILGRGSTVTAAGATALCAVALAPLRRRLQRRADKRLYPIRQAALTALDDLRQRTHAGVGQPEQLEESLRTALRDPELRVGFLVPGATGFVDAGGVPVTADAPRSTPVRLAGREIGVLTAGRHGSRELLREVADASALLVEVVRLRLELSQALREVESSRARLLHIGYQERKRLERDLHDGAQQRLVSLGMALRLGQRHLDDDTVDVDGLLDQAVAELGTAVAELRQLAHGLRPSSLDDGLGPALAGLARAAPLTVEVDMHADGLPDDVATTAYYVASEAVTNAVKHARADRIGLQVNQDNGRLRVRIEDDGVGGVTERAGSGLAGLHDRVAAAGGTLVLHSPPGGGTVVEAVLPCAS